MLDLLAGFVVLLMVGPPVLLTAGGLLLFVAGIGGATLRRARTRFHCPWTNRVVTVDFLLPAGSEHPSRVTSCTAFRDPTRVTCKQACRELADVRSGVSLGIFPGWALTAGGPVMWEETTPVVAARR